MNRLIHAALLCALLAGCSTSKVQTACESAEAVLQVASPFLAAAPAIVQTAVTLLGAGAYACGTPEYAAAREVVAAWLLQRGFKTQ